MSEQEESICIIEEHDHVIIRRFPKSESDKASLCFDKLKNGFGFDGFTPRFFLISTEHR